MKLGAMLARCDMFEKDTNVRVICPNCDEYLEFFMLHDDTVHETGSIEFYGTEHVGSEKLRCEDHKKWMEEQDKSV